MQTEEIRRVAYQMEIEYLTPVRRDHLITARHPGYYKANPRRLFALTNDLLISLDVGFSDRQASQRLPLFVSEFKYAFQSTDKGRDRHRNTSSRTMEERSVSDTRMRC